MLKSITKSLLSASVAFSALALSSCNDSFIYEDEGDCRNYYRIRFVYDMNLKWADAFASEVKSVNLYLFDEQGLFVKEFDVAGDALAKPGFCIEFDDETVTPGNYTFVAWCGLENVSRASESFTVPAPEVGVTTLEELTCTLNTLKNDLYPEYSDTMLQFLYHGMLKANLPDQRLGQTYDYTIYLTKDTNHIRIILQELSGEDIDASEFTISITGADGRLAYDNSVIPNSPEVVYLPWSQQSDLMGLASADGEITYNYGLVADLSTSRMVTSQENEFYLTVFKNDSKDEIIARIPVIQYALLAKDYYNMAYGHDMGNQEFLDREDEYSMTFFLYNGKWMNSYIDINSWRVVLHDYDLGQ